MNQEVKLYLENIRKPWGQLFYRIIFNQLPNLSGLKILDYGSGLGITANYYAFQNEVTAIEPNLDFVYLREKKNTYLQITGEIDQLRLQESDTYDVVLCHNVLEYTTATERIEILQELTRILKSKGYISIVKHNLFGRIMQKTIFENNLNEAMLLLHNGEAWASLFGKIDYYNINEIINSINQLKIEKEFGVRTFYALQQNNNIKFEKDWQEKMLEIELKASEIKCYRDISFFNHYILRNYDKGIDRNENM